MKALLLAISWMTFLGAGISGINAWAMGSGKLDETKAVQDLFSNLNPAPLASPAAKNTYIIFLNGDQDHFVEKSTTSTDTSLHREDTFESDDIQEVGENCDQCNLVFLHAQRGAAHWYTNDTFWATYLRIYSRGSKILEKHVDQIDMADPLVLKSLITVAAQTFPGTRLNLIYRGHSFVPTYDPATSQKLGIAPFDYGSPESAYGANQFVQSIHDAGFMLSTVTIAACRMAYFQLASMLSPFSKYLVASQLDFLEVLDTQVDYTFIWDTTDEMTEQQVANAALRGVLIRDRIDSNVTDAMMETPFSLISLSGMDQLQAQFAHLNEELEPVISNPLHDPVLVSASVVKKGVSPRYIDSLKTKGKSDAEIAAMAGILKLPSEDVNDRDVGLYLTAIQADPRTSARPDLRAAAAELQSAISSHIQLDFPGPFSKNTGMTFEANGF